MSLETTNKNVPATMYKNMSTHIGRNYVLAQNTKEDGALN